MTSRCGRVFTELGQLGALARAEHIVLWRLSKNIVVGSERVTAKAIGLALGTALGAAVIFTCLGHLKGPVAQNVEDDLAVDGVTFPSKLRKLIQKLKPIPSIQPTTFSIQPKGNEKAQTSTFEIEAGSTRSTPRKDSILKGGKLPRSGLSKLSRRGFFRCPNGSACADLTTTQ